MFDLTEFRRQLESQSVGARPIYGTVSALGDGGFRLAGVEAFARIGDGVRLTLASGRTVRGEVVALTPPTAQSAAEAVAMAFDPLEGASVGDMAALRPSIDPAPSRAWLGHVIGPDGRAVSGEALEAGETAPLRAPPPPALTRRGLGARLRSGHAAFDAMLPLCRGQRVGVFAGSGVGKSRLMAALAQRMDADVVVIGLIGERGREVRAFVEETLGPEAMARAVVVVATADQPAALKRRAAWLTLAVAERFRRDGAHVLLLFDSLTRFAEAHREVALTGGESPGLGGFPPSTTGALAALCERAGPGPEGEGDVTAVFTVLVAGSDMDEPVADMTRGILDGHVVLSREIAERGRFPAIDMRRSVSRSLPEAASDAENALIADARRRLAAYEDALPMLQVGLYKDGTDPELDAAIRIWPALDAFFAAPSDNPEAAFQRLAEILAL